MIATPFISPKYTNFQSAPCHKPETANVINMGSSRRKITLDELLNIKILPKYNEIGEYKYNIKNLDFSQPGIRQFSIILQHPFLDVIFLPFMLIFCEKV